MVVIGRRRETAPEKIPPSAEAGFVIAADDKGGSPSYGQPTLSRRLS
jgi:hypothetical protein